MEKIKVDLEKCKGCYYCVSVCPTGSITVSKTGNTKGFRTIMVNQDKCIQCGRCYRICPDYVFELLQADREQEVS